MKVMCVLSLQYYLISARVIVFLMDTVADTRCPILILTICLAYAQKVISIMYVDRSLAMVSARYGDVSTLPSNLELVC
jgi:hypothetical protein